VRIDQRYKVATWFLKFANKFVHVERRPNLIPRILFTRYEFKRNFYQVVSLG